MSNLDHMASVAVFACVVVDMDPKDPMFEVALNALRTAVNEWRDALKKEQDNE